MPTKDNEVILAIDTATDICSISLLGIEETLYTIENDARRNHATLIAVYVREALELVKKERWKIIALAINAGPGSYTGLRIGSSFAKGFCFARQIPLIALNGLEILVRAYKRYNLANTTDKDLLLCPMIDAKRMEVYYALYDYKINELISPDALVVTKDHLNKLSNGKRLYCFGNGAMKCQELINNERISFEDMSCLSHNLQAYAFEAFDKKLFVDIAYWEPDYIKDYKAIKSKNKVLNR